MKRLVGFVAAFALVAMVGAAGLFPATAEAVEVFEECEQQNSSVCTGQNSAPNMIEIVINTALYVLGMVAVLMIVIGGIRYTTSAGNSAQTKSAKDTILYAVIGLVVAILAYTIVNFVLNWFE
ncbi:pilin [Streptomyces caniscabiei]|uniref:pilin n=1 Tax=Streptomyces caniscabiei TaxID=2746961 RepID=UPI0029B6DAB4|nr:pilin [Streptomyces caniscabiei]MDX2776379.1 pilin [Streptomyces caniscabiei]